MSWLPACLAAEPQVLVLNQNNAPPYSNAQRTGFYDVLASEAFRRAGLELRIDTPPALAVSMRAMKRDGAYQRAYRAKHLPYLVGSSR